MAQAGHLSVCLLHAILPESVPEYSRQPPVTEPVKREVETTGMGMEPFCPKCPKLLVVCASERRPIRSAFSRAFVRIAGMHGRILVASRKSPFTSDDLAESKICIRSPNATQPPNVTLVQGMLNVSYFFFAPFCPILPYRKLDLFSFASATRVQSRSSTVRLPGFRRTPTSTPPRIVSPLVLGFWLGATRSSDAGVSSVAYTVVSAARGWTGAVRSRITSGYSAVRHKLIGKIPRFLPSSSQLATSTAPAFRHTIAKLIES
jgi:hypothetical protein